MIAAVFSVLALLMSLAAAACTAATVWYTNEAQRLSLGLPPRRPRPWYVRLMDRLP